MRDRERNLGAYERAGEELTRHHGEYVVVRDGRIVAFRPTFEEAFRLADGDPDALVLQAGARPVREPVRLGSRTWPAA
ncbi:MAG: DUF5678 domain-containing protein [Chloroflexota bacterium]